MDSTPGTPHTRILDHKSQRDKYAEFTQEQEAGVRAYSFRDLKR
jgi:hypothetical protein